MARTDDQARRRIGEILVEAGVISKSQLIEALEAQRGDGRRARLGTVIVSLALATEDDIAHALATQLGYDTVDLTAQGPEPAALQRVPRKLAERHQVLPLRIEDLDVLVVAMSDPTNVVALDDIRLTSAMRAVRPVVAPESELIDAIRRAFGTDQAALDIVDSLGGHEDVAAIEETNLEDLSAVSATAGAQPIVRLANAILADAVRTRASDVHIEPERDGVRVRYRIDGLLREKMDIPRGLGPALLSRIKITANLDIAERRLPQDGRSAIRVEDTEVDLRVSTMPTLHGETIVLRLLRKGEERLSIDDLGLASDSRELFESALARPQGLVLLTGPTGSGKTTTLYAGLTELTDPVRNVITLEDPIEYQLQGVNQTQVNPKIGLTFARGLRTVLRQDPDVVMVGEIRDQETAELAMEASFTGHLVLSTLHTNNAPSTIVRLHDLGVERFMIASSVILVIAQRLVRVVCDHCKEPYEPDERTLRHLGLDRAELSGRTLMRGAGCQLCDGSGYRGRLGVYEMLPVDTRLRDLIVEDGTETAVGQYARDRGQRTLRQDALLKAYNGLTTLEEVLRITPEDQQVGDGSGDQPAPGQLPGELTVTVARDFGPKVEPGSTPGSETSDTAASARTGESSPAPRKRPPAGTKWTVLVVDDDPSLRELVTTLLMDDHVVLQAEDGESAVTLARSENPDAIILDYRLPDIDGIEVTRLLRADEVTSGIAVLMLTGVVDPEVEVEGLLAGVDDYLTKPFDEEVLRARLQAAMHRASRLR
ncbi:MAG: Flp pilus assembly complex ATPase component TadA [Actinobacteria bacterium]|nr:Flp pilus assembly complex ATPase component TadA [Actinomycetota bacterium]